MIATVLMYAAVTAALVFVGWPLFSAGGDEVREAGVDPLEALERQKREAYAALKDAEFDRRMGKLSDDDFAAITQRNRQQALAAIAALEQAQRAPSPRKSPRAAVRFAFCPGCGARLAARANFCAGCGRSLRDSAA